MISLLIKCILLQFHKDTGNDHQTRNLNHLFHDVLPFKKESSAVARMRIRIGGRIRNTNLSDQESDFEGCMNGSGLIKDERQAVD
jgi:hypothetical protein